VVYDWRMENRAARRRLSRRVKAEQRKKAAHESTPPGGRGIVMPSRTRPDGRPSGTLTNTSISGFPIGVEVPEGGHTFSERLHTANCTHGVVNRGKYDERNATHE